MSIDHVQLASALEDIRPRLRGHAGDMTVTEDEPGVATIEFAGACESCPAMAVTFAGLVRTKLLQVAGVDEVRAPQVHASPRSLNRIARTLGATEVPLISGAPSERRVHCSGK